MSPDNYFAYVDAGGAPQGGGTPTFATIGPVGPVGGGPSAAPLPAAVWAGLPLGAGVIGRRAAKARGR